MHIDEQAASVVGQHVGDVACRGVVVVVVVGLCIGVFESGVADGAGLGLVAIEIDVASADVIDDVVDVCTEQCLKVADSLVGEQVGAEVVEDDIAGVIGGAFEGDIIGLFTAAVTGQEDDRQVALLREDQVGRRLGVSED